MKNKHVRHEKNEEICFNGEIHKANKKMETSKR